MTSSEADVPGRRALVAEKKTGSSAKKWDTKFNFVQQLFSNIKVIYLAETQNNFGTFSHILRNFYSIQNFFSA